MSDEAGVMQAAEYGYKDAGYKTPAYLLDGVLSSLPRQTPERDRLLEIGCGNGYVAADLARRGWQVVGTDASADGVAIAQATYGSSGARFETASIYDRTLAARLKQFDVIVAIEVIEHLQLPRVLFENALELLKPGGRLIVTTPYHGYLKNLALSVTNGWDAHFAVHWDAGHLRFFSPKTLGAMAGDCGLVNSRWCGLGRSRWLWKSFLFQAERNL